MEEVYIYLWYEGPRAPQEIIGQCKIIIHNKKPQVRYELDTPIFLCQVIGSSIENSRKNAVNLLHSKNIPFTGSNCNCHIELTLEHILTLFYAP